MNIDHLIRQRPFKYSEIYTHPPIPGMAFGGSGSGELIKDDIPEEVARVCKNESNGTVFLSDGTWVTTWGQGRAETHPDERIVCSLSTDMGKTWSEPTVIVASIPEVGERQAYGLPFVVPGTDRVYLFYFAVAVPEGKVWAREGRLAPEAREYPLQWSGHLYFVYSDDRCETWSERRKVDLPPRDINVFPDRWHAWVNHPGQVMPSGEAIFTFGNHPMNQMIRRRWQLTTAEANVVRCDNILTERDPEKLIFTLLPRGPRGIRTDPDIARECTALKRLADIYDGDPWAMAPNFQEMTVVALSDGRWVGVGRSFLGSPAYTVSRDRGETWSPGQPLCYDPGGDPIHHPMTMCPIAPVGDGRYVLLFTNNDGSERGAAHVWDGEGRTRNPQWFVVAREIPGEERNGGLVFGEPRGLVDVDNSGEVNLKTGISMPQFFVRAGRYFVAYNINKEHLLLDEIPAAVLDEMTPGRFDTTERSTGEKQMKKRIGRVPMWTTAFLTALTVVTVVAATATHASGASNGYYKVLPLFSQFPGEDKPVQSIDRFGPVGIGIELRQPAFRMRVRNVEAGSPAAATEKLKAGQWIDSINGRVLKGVDPRLILGDIIARAEATDGQVKLVVRDDEKAPAQEVVVTIPVLGAHSETWPLDCPSSSATTR